MSTKNPNIQEKVSMNIKKKIALFATGSLLSSGVLFAVVTTANAAGPSPSPTATSTSANSGSMEANDPADGADLGSMKANDPADGADSGSMEANDPADVN